MAEWGKWQIKKQHFYSYSREEQPLQMHNGLISCQVLRWGRQCGCYFSFFAHLFIAGALTLLCFFCYLLCIFTIEGMFYLCWSYVLCPLPYVFFSQSCITLVISNGYFVKCVYAPVVSPCACTRCSPVLRLCLYSPQPTLRILLKLNLRTDSIFRLDPKITVPCETTLSSVVPNHRIPEC